MLAHADGYDVVLRETASGRELHRFTEHSRPIRSVRFSPNGRRLVTADARSFALWRLRDEDDAGPAYSKVRSFAQPDVQNILWYGNEHLVAAFPSMLQLWKIDGPRRPAWKWDLSFDDDLLVRTAKPPEIARDYAVGLTRQGRFFLWDLRTHEVVRRIRLAPMPADSLVFGPGGRLAWRSYERRDRRERLLADRAYAMPVPLTESAADRGTLPLGGVSELRATDTHILTLHEDAALRIWSPEDGALSTISLRSRLRPRQLTVSDDGARAAFFCLNGCLERGDDSEIAIVDVEAGALVARSPLPFAPSTARVVQLAFADARGTRLVTRAGDSTLYSIEIGSQPAEQKELTAAKLFDPPDHELDSELHLQADRSELLSPRGNWLLRTERASGEKDTEGKVEETTLALYRVEDGRRTFVERRLPRDRELSCRFASRERLLACLSGDRLLTQPLARSEAAREKLAPDYRDLRHLLGISPSGEKLAALAGLRMTTDGITGDASRLAIYGIGTASEHLRFDAGPGHITAVDFLDDDRVAVGHADGTVDVWKLGATE
jgi:WD40 repeat protein